MEPFDQQLVLTFYLFVYYCNVKEIKNTSAWSMKMALLFHPLGTVARN